jgi:hypothetical protein
VNRVVNRWVRYELIVLDEMCYVAMPDTAAELLFQVVGGRAERAAVIVHESSVFGMDDHDRQRTAVQSDAGPAHRPRAHHRNRTESYRFRRTLAKNKATKA